MPAPPQPRLVTRRLVLQPLRPSHAPEVFASIAESRRTLRPWVPFATTTREVGDTLAFIRHASRSRTQCVWGIWERAVMSPARPGRHCGCLGLHGVSLDQATGALGYWLRSDREGRGYTTEAAAAVLLWAFGPLGLERMGVCVAPGNAPSLRVVEKLGFVREGVVRDAQKIPGRRERLDWIAFGMTREDFAAARADLARRCGAPRPWS